MSKARELAELSRTVSDSADAVAITIDSSENVTFANDIAVTGTVTADGLTVDGNVSVVSALPRIILEENDATDLNAAIRNNGGVFKIQTVNDAANSFTNRMDIDHSSGDIILHGNVGVGTSSPSSYFAPQLVVQSSTSYGGITIRSNSTTDTNYLVFADGTSGNERYRGYVSYDHNADTMKLATGASPAITIDSSSNVGIGTSSPDGGLDIEKTVNTAWSSALRANDFLQISNVSTTGGSYSGIELIATGVGAAGAAEIVCIDSGSGSGDLAFSTRNSSTWSEKVRVLAGGNVGIGTSSPSVPLTVKANGGGNSLRLLGRSADGFAFLGFRNSADSVTNGEIGISDSKHMLFYTNDAERMRIDSAGRLLHQTTSSTTYPTNNVFAMHGVGGEVTLKLGGFGGSHTMMQFLMGGNNVKGSIVSTGSATSYNTSSDQRLKENIADADDAGSKVDAIQVRKFDWIADGSHQDYGMVAQELQTVAPEAVSAPADPEEMMGVDYSKLVPMLVKEIQSLRARVQRLENN